MKNEIQKTIKNTQKKTMYSAVYNAKGHTRELNYWFNSTIELETHLKHYAINDYTTIRKEQ